jgi:hypothetical protein
MLRSVLDARCVPKFARAVQYKSRCLANTNTIQENVAIVDCVNRPVDSVQLSLVILLRNPQSRTFTMEQ